MLYALAMLFQCCMHSQGCFNKRRSHEVLGPLDRADSKEYFNELH